MKVTFTTDCRVDNVPFLAGTSAEVKEEAAATLERLGWIASVETADATPTVKKKAEVVKEATEE